MEIFTETALKFSFIRYKGFMEVLKYTEKGGRHLEEKLQLLWLILIFVDFGLMFISFPILIYAIIA